MAEGRVSAANSELELLPPKCCQRHRLGFAKRFFLSFMTAGYKLAQPDPPVPCSLARRIPRAAEELALSILVDDATSWLKDYKDIGADFGAFEDVVFQDTDFRWLYDMSQDGIDDTEEGPRLGVGHLHFDEWFKLFLNASTVVHPYSAHPAARKMPGPGLTTRPR